LLTAHDEAVSLAVMRVVRVAVGVAFLAVGACAGRSSPSGGEAASGGLSGTGGTSESGGVSGRASLGGAGTGSGGRPSGGRNGAAGLGGANEGGHGGAGTANQGGEAGAIEMAGTGGGGTGGGGTGGSGGNGGNGGADSVAGEGGAAGEGPCECQVSMTMSVRLVDCAVPLEAICCSRTPVICATTLDEALSSLSLDAFLCEDPDENDGLVSDCSDGTIELLLNDYGYDADMRMLFDADGNVIGKHYGGSWCGTVYSGTCGGPENDDQFNYQFARYEGGDLAVRSCVPRCELCVNRWLPNETLPRCAIPGNGGQGGGSG
jgi:hypothetical protein